MLLYNWCMKKTVLQRLLAVVLLALIFWPLGTHARFLSRGGNLPDQQEFADNFFRRVEQNDDKSDVEQDEEQESGKIVYGHDITELLEKGVIREATEDDLQDLKTAMMKNVRIKPFPKSINNTFVVTGDIVLDEALGNASRITFFVPEGYQRPLGNLGRLTIYYYDTGLCRGPNPDCTFK